MKVVKIQKESLSHQWNSNNRKIIINLESQKTQIKQEKHQEPTKKVVNSQHLKKLIIKQKKLKKVKITFEF